MPDNIPVMQYGTYQGFSYQAMVEQHPEHYWWARGLYMENLARPESTLSAQLRDYVEWVEDHYDIDFELEVVKDRQSGDEFKPTITTTRTKGKTKME